METARLPLYRRMPSEAWAGLIVRYRGWPATEGSLFGEAGAASSPEIAV